MAEAVFRCFFPGRVRLFGKTNGHSWESRATNATGKNALSQRRNKAERNCRHAQGTQRDKMQKLPHKKRTAPFPERYTIRTGKWGRFTFPEHSLSGLCCSTRSRAADKKENSPRQAGGVPFLCRWWGSNPHVLLAQGILSFYPHLPSGVIQ